MDSLNSKSWDKSFTFESTSRRLLNDIESMDGNYFAYKLAPIDVELLAHIASQLGNDYHSILNSGNEVDLIYFETRCTDIVRKLLDIVNCLVRFKFRLIIDESSNYPDTELLNFG